MQRQLHQNLAQYQRTVALICVIKLVPLVLGDVGVCIRDLNRTPSSIVDTAYLPTEMLLCSIDTN